MVRYGTENLDFMYKAYIFDFDYTLANSEKGIVMCFEMLFADEGYGPYPKDRIRATIGMTMYDTMSLLTGETSPAKLKELIKRYKIRYSDKYMTANTRLYKEVVPTLKTLKKQGALCCIVSTKNRSRIMETLVRDKITDLVDCVIGSEDVRSPKPSPEGIKKIQKRYALPDKDILYIGDTLIDGETAANSRVDFAAVTTGTTSAEDFKTAGYYRIMKNLSELI